MRLAHPVLALTLFAAAPLHAQHHHHGSASDTSEWLDDCRDGNSNWGDSERARSCEVRRSAVAAPRGHVRIDAGQNGSVSIVGGKADSMIVIAKIATSGYTADEAVGIARQIRIAVTPMSVSATGPQTERNQHWSVSFDVVLPRSADVSAETRNGGVYLEGLNGKVDARAVNGPVSVYEMAGDVTARTQNGPITAELLGTKWEGTGLDMQTQNGPVNLRIASGYNAHLETGTVNGPMSIDFPVTIQGRITKRFSIDLGSGGAPVRAITTNGPVSVRKL